MIAKGEDPAYLKKDERERYEYCDENYYRYINQLSTRYEKAQEHSSVKQRII